jgi:hypothetical protein
MLEPAADTAPVGYLAEVVSPKALMEVHVVAAQTEKDPALGIV